MHVQDGASGTSNRRKTSPGFLVVLSAPSGGGKTTILKRLLAKGDSRYQYSVSATTRKPRSGENHGRDYYFLSEENFHKMAADDEFLEHARVHGNYYGTPRTAVENWIAQGRIVLMDIDVQGGINVKRKMGSKALLIFIQPPSVESLGERLRGRNTDHPAEIDARLRAAAREMEQAGEYDYVVVNNDLDETVEKIAGIINRQFSSIASSQNDRSITI